MSRSKWKPRLLELLAGLNPRTPLPNYMLSALGYYMTRVDGKTCPFCGKSFTNKRGLIIHMSQKHDKEIGMAVRGKTIY